MNKCTIYYGMSGTLKLTTIESLHSDSFKVFSDTKPFFKMDEDYFNWSSRPNDAHLAIHRLLTLDLPGYLPSDKDIVIERGVTDNVFCIPNRKIPGMSKYEDIDILGLVNKEESIIKSRTNNCRIIKKLLVMKDEDFISKRVLNNRYRRSIYPSITDYLASQDKYIEFTKRYNSISEVIIINNAKDYITNILNINYNE